MRDRPFNLAIETASRQGSLALGRGDTLLACADLPVQRRHRVGLMPGIAELCARNDVTPADLGELYVSLGPGSFTGLRVAMAAAATLTIAQPARLVGVPTLDVLARNTPQPYEHVAVCLNVKREQAWSAVFRRDGEGWEHVVEPALRSLSDLLDAAPRPLVLLGDPLPSWPEPLPDGVTELPADLARPRAEAVWQVGRTLARLGQYIAPAQLQPIYARPPEAVTLWDQRHATGARQSHNQKLKTQN